MYRTGNKTKLDQAGCNTLNGMTDPFPQTSIRREEASTPIDS